MSKLEVYSSYTSKLKLHVESAGIFLPTYQKNLARLSVLRIGEE